jgi:hypothetical protein
MPRRNNWLCALMLIQTQQQHDRLLLEQMLETEVLQQTHRNLKFFSQQGLLDSRSLEKPCSIVEMRPSFDFSFISAAPIVMPIRTGSSPSGVSTCALCAEAGMGPGNLFRYFPSKEALMAGIAERDRAELAQQFASADLSQGLFNVLQGMAHHHFAEKPTEKVLLCTEVR